MDEDKKLPTPEKVPAIIEGNAADFKKQVVGELEQQAAALAAWKEFWKVWLPGGLRKRKRYRTPGHGKRKGINRRRNKAARATRKRQRPVKKRRK